MTLRKSRVAAKELGITYHRLFALLRFEKIPPPEKDTSGDYIWTDDDLAAARKALVEKQSKKKTVESVQE